MVNLLKPLSVRESQSLKNFGWTCVVEMGQTVPKVQTVQGDIAMSITIQHNFSNNIFMSN